ncbi:MAG: hypothetical protein KGL39_11755 [Patescibacteria group bacterium]|nr:hypothetical protein [Patescibacteria group bacterium]
MTVINSLASLAESIEKKIEGEFEQLELDVDHALGMTATSKLRTLADIQDSGAITRLAIIGEGSDTPELHVGNGTELKTFPLVNPVTAKQIAGILSSLT